MIRLDRRFLETRLAHRALHGAGRPENSLAAICAARDAGFGIEIDVQPSADGVAMIFHDRGLERLTGEAGRVIERSADALGRLRLLGTQQTIPTLDAGLAAAGDDAPVLIEIKDQDGAMGRDVGALERAVAAAVRRHPEARVAVMSFNPYSVAEMSRLLPDVPRGITTSGFRAKDWPGLPARVRSRLRGIPDYGHVDASFISHDARDLRNPRVAELKKAGAAILCWTIRSPAEERAARAVADNVTFEGYLPGA